MKCPVSMLPAGGNSMASIIFVIGVIVAISYGLKAQKNAIKSTSQANAK